jgi:hypothetical protein
VTAADSDPATDTVVTSGPATGAETEPAAAAEPATEAESGPAAESEAETEPAAAAESEAEPAAAAESEAEPAAAVASAAAVESAPATEVEVETEAESDTVPATPEADLRAREEASGTATTPPDESPAGFERGVVVYVRCDGIERPERRYPCPRDRKLEQAVWRALAQLPGCPVPTGEGRGEVRLDFRRGAGAPRLRVRALRGSLDGAAVEKCVSGTLRALRTRLRPDRMITAFRFALR